MADPVKPSMSFSSINSRGLETDSAAALRRKSSLFHVKNQLNAENNKALNAKTSDSFKTKLERGT